MIVVSGVLSYGFAAQAELMGALGGVGITESSRHQFKASEKSKLM